MVVAMKKEYKHKAYIYNRQRMSLVAVVHYDYHIDEAIEMINRLCPDKDKYGITDDEKLAKPDGRAPNLYAGVD